jgi:hypothetical protein
VLTADRAAEAALAGRWDVALETALIGAGTVLEILAWPIRVAVAYIVWRARLARHRLHILKLRIPVVWYAVCLAWIRHVRTPLAHASVIRRRAWIEAKFGVLVTWAWVKYWARVAFIKCEFGCRRAAIRAVCCGRKVRFSLRSW